MRRHAKVSVVGSTVRRTGLLATAAATVTAAFAIAASTALALPPGYVYEMASTPDKDGQGLSNPSTFPNTSISLSEDGNRLLYSSLGTFAGALSNTGLNSFLASRGVERWSTGTITPRVSSGNVAEGGLTGATAVGPVFASADLSKQIVFTKHDPETGAKLGRGHWYLHDSLTGTWKGLTPHEALEGSSDYLHGPVAARAAAVTPNLRYMVFATGSALLPEAIGVSDFKGYVIDTVTGETTMGTVLGGTPGTPVGVNELGGTLGANSHLEGPLSKDGRYLFFEPAGLNPNPGVLHRRDIQAGVTEIVNAEENADLEVPLGPARFRDATPDGRFVFFVSGQRLVETDTNEGNDLYRWDGDAPVGERLTLITADGEPADGTGGVSGALGSAIGTAGASVDGSRVYFETLGQQLIEGLPTGSGLRHLYLWDDGTLKHVASSDHLSGPFPENLGTSAGTAFRGPNSALTPDAGTLAFRAAKPLTPPLGGAAQCPFQNGSAELRVGPVTDPCHQIYVYEADSSTATEPDIVCASCAKAGPTPSPANFQGGGNPSNELTNLRRGTLSDDGRLVFYTRASLLPTDTNGTRVDVYTYKAGKLDLVSTGRDPVDSWGGPITPDGTAISFITAQSLSGWDYDDVHDAYVARLGGGLPEPPPPAFECEGDACQPPPIVPNDPSPASAGFRGVGDPQARRDCTAARKRAQVLKRRATRLARAAKRSSKKRRSGALLRRARQMRRQASGLDRRANRCRQTERRAR